MKFISMLDDELLLGAVPGNSKEEVYTCMLQTLAEYSELELEFADTVKAMRRQEESAGVLMPNLAMPHLRINELHDLFIVVGLPENPEAVGAKVVLMSLIGDDMSDVYLKIISTLARHLCVKSNAEKFFAAADAGKDAFWEYLQSSNMTLRTVVSAEDVMSPVDGYLKADAPLSKAFDIFSKTHRRFLPVVDADGKLVGELSARKVVRSFFPEYVFMMDNLNFLNDFAVFNEIFHSEHTLPISQYMNNEPLRATLDTPLIQLTLLLSRHEAGNVYIVDEENHLRGIFTIDNIISKVLRG